MVMYGTANPLITVQVRSELTLKGRVGFEPTVYGLHIRQFSRLVP